jgi:L-iditol 2-dehydrogenase
MLQMTEREIPATSRAAVVTAFNEPLEVRELQVPSIEPGAVLVRIDAATVCGSDLHIWTGALAAGGFRPIELPVVPGHEMAGEVVATGGDDIGYTGGGKVRVGDKIVFTQGRCGTCFHCAVANQPSLCSDRRPYGDNCERYPYLVGTYSEYCYAYPTSRKVKIPTDVRPEWASAGTCALRTVIHGFERLGPVEPWQTIVIQGSGPLGLFATALASKSGAQRIIVIGAPDARLDLARAWGATDIVSVISVPDPAARVESVRELTNGQGADVVMEWSGGRTAFVEGLDMVRRGGRFVVGGQVGPHTAEIQPAAIMKNHLSIIGSASAAESHYWKAMDFLSKAQDDFEWDRMLTGRYGLDRVTEAYEGMLNLSEIKPVIIPTL